MSYQGKVLRIDLSTGKAEAEDLNEQWARAYLGGKGLALKYLYEELETGINPLSSDNKLILMTGPLTGTIVPNSGKLAIAAKSPATGTVLDCSIGGSIASEIKYAGYDAIIVEGASKLPVYICIEDDRVSFCSAKNVWGKGAHETEHMLSEKYNQAKALVIGQAGENKVPMSCINTDLYRQAGRGGIGAVMGSKNLKAIVVKGTGSVRVPDTRKFMVAMNKYKREDTLTDSNLWASEDGTSMLVDLANNTGTLPTRNFQKSTFEGHTNINASSIKEQLKAKKACFACPLACGNYVNFGCTEVEGPEYETLALCGSNCEIDDLEAVVEFNRLCDDYGLDTISTGNTVAFAMELAEKGVHDFGLQFGSVESYLKAPGLIALQQDEGKELSKGVKYLSEKYGGKEYAMQSKGLEFPGYEPRGSWAMSLAYATSDRGACHMRAWPIGEEAYGSLDPFTIENKAKLVKNQQDEYAFKFSAIFCSFWALSADVQADILTKALGYEVTVSDLYKIGERICNLARLFNQNEGFSGKDDVLPDRLFEDELLDAELNRGPLPRSEFLKMLKEYYDIRGWDEEGCIPEKLIADLGL